MSRNDVEIMKNLLKLSAGDLKLMANQARHRARAKHMVRRIEKDLEKSEDIEEKANMLKKGELDFSYETDFFIKKEVKEQI